MYQFGFGPLGPPLMSVHAFVVDGLLIDTAQRHMQKAVIGRLTERRIDRILLTHHHEDHSGNAAALAELFQAPVFGHPVTARKLSHPFSIFIYQHLIWGNTATVQISPFPKTIETDNHRFVPIHTPGHSKDHTVFLEPDEGWLFSGDLYLNDTIKYFRADENITDQILSLRKIVKKEFNVLFCAHRPALKNGKQHLSNKLAFLEDFYGEIQAMTARGDTEKEIIKRKKNREVKSVKWMSVGNVCFANMVKAACRSAPMN